MPNDIKIKTYKNPNRANEQVEHKPYVPQYQVHGVEPKHYHGGGIALMNSKGDVKIAKPSTVNPRENIRPELRQQTNQPYAEIDTNISHIKNVMPNSGNNSEQLWAAADGEIVDDLSDPIDTQSEMIDNNDYVSDQALGIYQSGPTAEDLEQPKYAGKVIIEEANNSQQYNKSSSNKDNNDLLVVLNELDSDAFLLIVSGVPICSGPKEEIEEQVRSFLFGDNQMCQGEPIPTEDIIVIKKVKIKVGAFLE